MAVLAELAVAVVQSVEWVGQVGVVCLMVKVVDS